MANPFGDPTPFVGPDKAVTVLALSSVEEDHESLRRIFGRSNWRIHQVRYCREAVRLLRQEPIPVVLCERDLADGSWKDILNALLLLDHPPLLIVTSRHADDRLWAEVLNLGGYDVLPKPFESDEVIRIVSLAWLHWKQCAATMDRAVNPHMLKATA